MEFLNVMLKVWMKYWSLFLQGLGMTLFMGLLTVLISTVFGSLMALMRRSNVGIGKFKPLRLKLSAVRRSCCSYISSTLCCRPGFRSST